MINIQDLKIGQKIKYKNDILGFSSTPNTIVVNILSGTVTLSEVKKYDQLYFTNNPLSLCSNKFMIQYRNTLFRVSRLDCLSLYEDENDNDNDIDLMLEQDNEKYFVRAVVPGFKETELSVSIEGKKLTVSGKTEKTIKEGNLHSSTISIFNNSLYLPDDAMEYNMVAEHKNGILVISIPRKTNSETKKQIPIKAT